MDVKYHVYLRQSGRHSDQTPNDIALQRIKKLFILTTNHFHVKITPFSVKEINPHKFQLTKRNSETGEKKKKK